MAAARQAVQLGKYIHKVLVSPSPRPFKNLGCGQFEPISRQRALLASCSVQAFKNLDYGQFIFLFEALHERNVLLRNVPYLSNSLPIMTARVGRC